MRHHTNGFDIIDQSMSVTVTDNDGYKYVGFAARDTGMMTISSDAGLGSAFITSVEFDYNKTPVGKIADRILHAVVEPTEFTIDLLREGDFLYCRAGAYWGVVTRPFSKKLHGEVTWFKWSFDSGDVLRDWLTASMGMYGIDVVLRKTINPPVIDVQYIVENELPHNSVLEMARRMSRSITSRNFQILHVTP